MNRRHLLQYLGVLFATGAVTLPRRECDHSSGLCNHLTSKADLTEESLEQMLIQLRDATDDQGKRLAIQPNKAWVWYAMDMGSPGGDHTVAVKTWMDGKGNLHMQPVSTEEFYESDYYPGKRITSA